MAESAALESTGAGAPADGADGADGAEGAEGDADLPDSDSADASSNNAPGSDAPTVIAVAGGGARESDPQASANPNADGDDAACALSGRIVEAAALCDIITFVSQALWRGELVVVDHDGTTKRSLFFCEGDVIAAESTAATERLGEVLCRRGVLSRAEVAACGDIVEMRGARFGEVAVERGLLTREALFEWMGTQLEEIFIEAVLVERGWFAFFHGYDETRLSFRRRHSVNTLLLEAIQRMDKASYFRAWIPSGRHIPVRTTLGRSTQLGDRLEPQADPLGVYAATDGVRTVIELAEVVGATELDVTRALAQHVQTGHIAMKPPLLTVAEIVGVYNEAILVLLRELDAMDEGDEVREQLTKFAANDRGRPPCLGAPSEDGTLEIVNKRDGDEDDGKDDNNNNNNTNNNNVDVDVNVESLSCWLYDYASYALFLSRPHLQRRDVGTSAKEARVSHRVAELLEAIAPRGNRTLPPPRWPQDLPRITVPVPAANGAAAPAPAQTRARPGEEDDKQKKGPVRLSSTTRMRRVTAPRVPVEAPRGTVRIAAFKSPSPSHANVPRAPAPNVSVEPIVPAVPTGGVVASSPNGEASNTTATFSVTKRSLFTRDRIQTAFVVVALVGAGAAMWLATRSSQKATAVPYAAVTGSGSPAASLTTPESQPPSSLPPRTEIVIACEPKCTHAYLDGKLLASSTEPVAVTAGTHELVVRKPGFAPEYKRVVVAEGESRAVTFELVTGPAARQKRP